jgi:hypothetical protein
MKIIPFNGGKERKHSDMDHRGVCAKRLRLSVDGSQP